MLLFLWIRLLLYAVLWSPQKEYLISRTTPQLSGTRTCNDQRAGTQYTSFKVTALAYCAF